MGDLKSYPDELSLVDEDIAKKFRYTTYTAGTPTMMQLARNLRQLTKDLTTAQPIEYKMVHCLSPHSPHLTNEELNRLGAKGWDFVAIWGTSVLFKRIKDTYKTED